MPTKVDWSDSHQRFLVDKEQHLETLTQLWPFLHGVEAEESQWGDEVEYLIVQLDHEAREARVSPRASCILKSLEQKYPEECFDVEAYQFMLESQPRRPYGGSLRDLARVKEDMTNRQSIIRDQLLQDERVISLTNFATIGSSQTQMDFKALITEKQRYKDLFSNIPSRAGDIESNYGHFLESIPVAPSHKKTTVPVNDPIDGLGGCGLQVTISANKLEEACQIHDQMIPLGPFMLALSAATPIYKGKLVATDTRWATMCMAVDDRKSFEKSTLHPRLGCTPMYLEECPSAQQLNDRSLSSIPNFESSLHAQGVPPALAAYFAHILSRDPMADISRMPDGSDTSGAAQVIRKELLYLHMSTWWPHVRLKLPVPSTEENPLPWRLEFRPMESQPGIEENAGMVVGTRLLQQTIQHFDLDLRVPISTVEDNFERTAIVDAATRQEFWFSVQPRGNKDRSGLAFEGWATLNVVFNGGSDATGRTWTGFVPLARSYLGDRGICQLSHAEQEPILSALDLLSGRASGNLETPARWMRTFVNERSNGEFPEGEISPNVYYEAIRALSE